MNNIGLKIKELRKEKKLTQEDFSEIIGIDNSQLSKIERGMLNPTLTQVMEISSKFSVPLKWLTEGVGTSNNQKISGNNNTMAGNDMNIDSNSKATIDELMKELKECKKLIAEKDNQINKLINLIDKLK